MLSSQRLQVTKETGYDEAEYDEQPKHQVMEGTITLYSSHVKAFFDTGATHSFIAVKIIQKLGITPQNLDIALNAASPLGATCKLGHACKDCPLDLEDRSLSANLIVLSMKEFDVILGMDWLIKYYTKLDCVRKRILFLEIGRAHV